MSSKVVKLRSKNRKNLNDESKNKGILNSRYFVISFENVCEFDVIRHDLRSFFNERALLNVLNLQSRQKFAYKLLHYLTIIRYT